MTVAAAAHEMEHPDQETKCHMSFEFKQTCKISRPDRHFDGGKQACGSGGTAAGMALGLHLSGLGCQLHAMGVCDDPDYFYNYMDGLLEGMGATKGTIGQLHAYLVSHHSHYPDALLLVVSERSKACSVCK